MVTFWAKLYLLEKLRKTVTAIVTILFFRIGPISPTVLVLCFMPFSNFGTKLRSLGRKCNFKNLTVGTDIDIALTG